MASLYAYTGKIEVKPLVDSFNPWLEDRCKQILNFTFHLQCHAALWGEEFQKPSWIVYNLNCFWTTHGGSRLLVAYLRGDRYINANIICQYTEPPLPGLVPFTNLKVINNMLKWDDDDHKFTEWCIDSIEFEHGIKIKCGSINHILIDKKPVQTLQGHYISVTRRLLEKVSDWNKDKEYWKSLNT